MRKRPDQLACHQCPLGYTSCRAGTPKTDWIERVCESCKQTNYFDPDVSRERCVDSVVKDVYRSAKSSPPYSFQKTPR